MSKPQYPQKAQKHADAQHEAQPQSDVQGNAKASVNPFVRTGNHNTQEQNPSRNDGAHRAPMGRDAGKDPQKVTPIRRNPQGNKPMSHDV
jgi:hypothetical protein